MQMLSSQWLLKSLEMFNVYFGSSASVCKCWAVQTKIIYITKIAGIFIYSIPVVYLHILVLFLLNFFISDLIVLRHICSNIYVLATLNYLINLYLKKPPKSFQFK